MLKRVAAVLSCCALVGTTTAAQDRPEVVVDVRPAAPGTVYVSLHGLLTDRRFLSAMESGFPLYLEYRVQLRQARPLWDRTVAEIGWEYVVLFDPVRESFAVEDPDGSEEFGDRAALERRLGHVYFVDVLTPDRDGEFYYKGIVHARTLSDEDIDEVFAWLKGEDGDSAPMQRPGFVTRTARRLLRQVAPLPRMTLEGRTANFRH